MIIIAAQKKSLACAYYNAFNSSIKTAMLGNTKYNEALAPALAHLKHGCDIEFDFYDIAEFQLNFSYSSVFGFTVTSINIDSPDMHDVHSELMRLGKVAAKKYMAFTYQEYVADIKKFTAASKARSEFDYSGFASLCETEQSTLSDQGGQCEFDDLFTSEIPETGSVTESSEAFPSNNRTSMLQKFQRDGVQWCANRTEKQLWNMTVSELIKKGTADIQELLNNLCWMLYAKQQQMGKTPEKSDITAVNMELFLAAAAGSVGFNKHFGALFDKPAFMVRFPGSCIELRDHLLEQVDDRTSESGSGSTRGPSKHWFEKAEADKKSKIALNGEVISLLKKVLTKAQDGSISFSTDCLRELQSFTLKSSELNHFPDTNETLLCDFVNDNASDNESSRFIMAKRVKNALNAKIIGQPGPVESVSAALSSVIINGSKKHLGVSTFFGVSGTGKTYMAETIAEVFTDVLALNYQVQILNMEQYSDELDVMKLFGSGSQYTDSALGGITLPVLKNPRTIYVFDELEKAHPLVVQSLLTLIDKGELQDRTTKQKIDFSLCYFVFTTNIGSATISGSTSVNEMDVVELLTRKKAQSDRVLSPEMANRLAAGNVSLFRPFDAKSLVKMASNTALQQTMKSRIDWPENTHEIILATLGGSATPRKIYTQLSKLEGRILNEQLSALPEDQIGLLNSIRFSYGRVVNHLSVRVSVISGLEMFTDLEDDMTDISTNTALPSVMSALKGDSDVIIIDESTLSAKPDEVAELLAEQGDKMVITISTNGKQSRLAAFCSSSMIYGHHMFMDDADPILIGHVLDKSKRIGALVKDMQNAINRNTIVDFSFSYTYQKDGVDVSLRPLSSKQAVKAEDAELPFLSFAGKPEGGLSDVIGQDKIKKRLELIANTMTNRTPASSQVPIPSGYLLTGLPGTGKTHMARCLAAQSDMFFFNVNSADLLIGNAIDNVNKLFEIANRYSPSIIFLDEIDSIAKDRQRVGHANAIVVNTLLTAMDGFGKKSGKVFIMAATNNPQELDPALSRAGRFDRTIYFDLPDKLAREVSVEQWFESKQYALDEALKEELVVMLEGATIGRISEIFDNSILTAMTDGEQWQPHLLIEAIRSVKLGAISQSVKQTKQQIANTAYHEAGHLLAHKLLLPEVPVEFASVQPRGASLGMVVPGATESEPVLSKQRVKAYLQVFLAGIAAEKMIGLTGDAQTIGGTDDRRKATQLAKNAILNWGMSDAFGFAIPSELSIDDKTVNSEVNNWLATAFEDVSTLLTDNQGLLEKVSATLVEREQLDKTEIDSLFGSFMVVDSPKKAA
jgi:ATP-dependent Zn protease